MDVYCENGSLDLTVKGVVVQNNMSYGMGGGIVINAGLAATGEGNGVVTMEIRDSVIRYNQALKRGGGIKAHSYAGSSSIDLFIVNSLIYKNQASWTGGGIDVSASEVGDNNVTRLMVINSTITSNVSDRDGTGNPGGGIRVRAYGGNGAIASLDLYNTIVYGNTWLGGEAGQDLHFGEDEPGDATVNAYHSDIGDVGGDPDLYNPVNVINADPAFVDPASDDYHLTSGSPCRDKGTTAVPDPPGLPTTDFEGDSRVIGAAPDIGADEYKHTHHIYLPLVTKNYP